MVGVGVSVEPPLTKHLCNLINLGHFSLHFSSNSLIYYLRFGVKLLGEWQIV